MFIGAVNQHGTRFILDLRAWAIETRGSALTYVCDSETLAGAKRYMATYNRRLKCSNGGVKK